jgi:hypothetical protein
VEELSYLKYNNRLDLLGSTDPSPKSEWRYCHIGGDDHLAVGPNKYLDLITEHHLRAGSHIDPGKHGYSSISVRYTERVLDLRNRKFQAAINKDYPKSIIVDSVKVRLLERGESTLLKKDNKNVAIGKCSQMAGCVQWLPNDDRHWPLWKKIAIRDLFINRMGALLPSRFLHPKCFNQILLPKSLGGFGLGLNHELYGAYLLSTEPIRWLLNKAHLGLNIRDELRLLSKLNTNTSTRGVEGIQRLRTEIVEQLLEHPGMVDAINWKTLCEKFPMENENNRYTLAKAREAGYLSFEEFADYSTRACLFQELLVNDSKLKVFNTNPYTSTMRGIWTEFESLGMPEFGTAPLEESVFRKILRNLNPSMFFDTSQITTADIGFWDGSPETESWNFIDIPYRDLYSINLPNLIVGLRFLGVRG